MREYSYVGDTELLEAERELRGPTLDDLIETRTTTYEYDDNDNLIREQRSTNGSSRDFFTYTYEDGVRVSGEWVGEDGTKLADFDYSYDNEGRLRSKRTGYRDQAGLPASEERYERDELGRVVRYEYYTNSTLQSYSRSDYSCHEG